MPTHSHTDTHTQTHTLTQMYTMYPICENFDESTGMFKKANLKLNIKKCRFCCCEVEYLGHIVTPNGFKPNIRNVEAIKEFPVPTTVKELRQFLGLPYHYCRFVKGFSKITQPLYALTKKDVPYHRTAECDCTVDHLKTCLITPPVLSY